MRIKPTYADFGIKRKEPKGGNEMFHHINFSEGNYKATYTLAIPRELLEKAKA